MSGSSESQLAGEKGSSTLFPAMRDKLQSSARDLIKSVEQAVSRGKPTSENVKSLESTLRAVFSSCTTGAEANVTKNNDEEYSDKDKPKGSYSSPQPQISSSRGYQKEAGEHIYAQLFYDDQIRGGEAITALKEIETRKSITPQKAFYSSQLSPKPFPPYAQAQTLQRSEFDIRPTNTFDDSISAISAHTLEAMARASGTPSAHNPSFPREVASSRNEKVERVEPSPVFVPKEHALSKPVAPVFRVRSTGDQSTPSKNSHSTPTTTDSSSFDNWQREENKFWLDQAKKDQLEKKQRRPSHGELVSSACLSLPR